MSEHTSEHNNGLRISLILALFFGALALVFSPLVDKLTHWDADHWGPKAKPMTSFVSLKPGIDMVGGTSLVYEIKKPEGVPLGGHLASDVAEALKLRVDPKGVKNLVWRPQGDDRLEIQMPLSPDAKDSADERRKAREQLIAAESKLKETNVQTEKVIREIESSDPGSDARLKQLADDSKNRQKLFADLKDLWTRTQKARASGDSKTWARLENEYNAKVHPSTNTSSAIDETNVSHEQLDELLRNTAAPTDADDKQRTDAEKERASELKELKNKFGDFPSRDKAIDEYVASFIRSNESQSDVGDATDLKRLLKGAGVLEYHILAAGSMNPSTYQKYATNLHDEGPRVHAGDEARWFLSDRPEKLGRTEEYNKKQYVLGYITPGIDGKVRSLDSHTESPWHLTDAAPEQQPSGEMAVRFQFDEQGGAYFGKLTEANIGAPMAIVLDNKIISAPVINGKIGSIGIITGGPKGFKPEELEYLVKTLKGGSLPAALSDNPIRERTIGPQLGQDNLRAGLIACFLGLVIVAVFLCGYYFTAGIVATFAVLMNVLLVLAVMSALNATFTLPSIAGIVLSVGTAVDANVLIFERLREEQHRGLSLRLALRNAYGKAFSAILDSNMTTVITSVFLIWFGTEEVKGFGVTLIIGIVASLFTALFVTRTIFSVMIENFGLRTLSSVPLVYPKWDKALRPNFDWMGKAWAFISFSVIGITVGMVLFFVEVRKGNMMGIEFASGTSIQFELANPMPRPQVEKLIEDRIKEKRVDASALPAFAVVTIGNDEKKYEFVTLNSDTVRVRDAMQKVLVDKDGRSLLKIDVPSKFDGTGGSLAEQLHNNIVIPLEDKKTPAATAWPNGFRPEEAKDFEPGGAIILNHLDPPLSVEQITERIKQQQKQLPGGTAAAALDFVVVAQGANGSATSSPVSSAVILCRNKDIPYSKDKVKWEEGLGAPLWQLVNESVNRPAQFQGVDSFDAQVAAEAARDALLALVLSIAVIMVYIWFRFGNLKYGTATMVALIHDALFTVAALGFAHYLYQVPGIGQLLKLEAFRIDLTVVAGILTIMGYSMIDTIVVFDRIRENRGKFGLVSRKTINDAINQTLSRTLLTAGINVMTVAIMYFLGGPGIHGFAFVLLIGILVGTYSSVAIAAPILLVGRQEEEVGRAGGQLRPVQA